MTVPQIKRFNGLNNVSDPLRLGMSWLVTADNVNISDTGAIGKREGYTLSQAGVYSGVYATQDYQRMYLVDDGDLRTFDGVVLKTGLSSAPMHWAEINGDAYFNNGVDRGVILTDNTLIDWAWSVPTAPNLAAVTGRLTPGLYQVRCTFVLADGRETGTSESNEITLGSDEALSITDVPHLAGALTKVYICPPNSTVYQAAATTTGSALVWNFSNDALGADLRTAFFDSLPVGTDVIQFFKGRIYAAQYFPSQDQTVVWFSETLAFHLFNLNTDFFILPGQVLMMAPSDEALIVGTQAEVYAYTGEKLTLLADYGVVAGQHWSRDELGEGKNRILFWTSRGVCAAMPFTNLTERSVSVAPGIKAGGTIVRHGGQKRYLAVLQQGGSAFNAL